MVAANAAAQQQHATSQNSMMYGVGSGAVNSNVSAMVSTGPQSSMGTAPNQIPNHHPQAMQQIGGSMHIQYILLQ